MKKYWEIMKAQIKEELAYSTFFWAGTFATLLRFIAIYYFWLAIYSNKSTISDITFQVMISYIIISSLFDQYVSGVGGKLADNIKSGNISIEFIRPYSVMKKLVFMDFGTKIANTFKNTVPLLLLASIFLEISFPRIDDLFLFVISGILAIGIGLLFDLLVGIIAFWTVNTWGLHVFKSGLMMILSGSVLPLTLYPDWLQQVSLFLPFQYMVFVPVAIYTDVFSMNESFYYMGLQIIWIIIMFILVKSFWSVAKKRVVIFGG